MARFVQVMVLKSRHRRQPAGKGSLRIGEQSLLEVLHALHLLAHCGRGEAQVMGDAGLFWSPPLPSRIRLPLALGFRQAESVVCQRRAAWTWSTMDPLGFVEVAAFMCSQVLAPHGVTGPAGGDRSATM